MRKRRASSVTDLDEYKASKGSPFRCSPDPDRSREARDALAIGLGLVRASRDAYSNPYAGIALEVDEDRALLRVLLGPPGQQVELRWTRVEARRIARQIFRITDSPEAGGTER